MYNNNSIEKGRIKDRARDFLMLSGLIIAAALVSIVVMDILLLPLVMFAIKHKMVFNNIIRYSAGIGVVLFLLYVPLKKVFFLRKHDVSAPQIARHVLSRPLVYFLYGLAFIILIFAIIAIIYMMMSYNDYMIYKHFSTGK